VREIRWHGRAGQGAKTASQLYALALMRGGAWVQAFPEYGPERSGAPMRAYTRVDEQPIRRRYGIAEPDAVVVLDPSLVVEANVTAGLARDGLLVVNSDQELVTAHRGRTVCVPASRLAAGGHVNVVMLGALAAALGDPPLDSLLDAAEELFGAKKRAALETSRTAIEAGHAAVRREMSCAA
jgi:pyruvate ferredoxin oxidoreductase gamma subunit